jgi:nucleoside-diphosphate-sugar epimerase
MIIVTGAAGFIGYHLFERVIPLETGLGHFVGWYCHYHGQAGPQAGLEIPRARQA